MNKKLFLLGTSLSTCLLAAGILAVASIKVNLPLSIVRGDDNPYSIDLNRSVTSQEVTAGEASFDTAAGNPILFKFDSSKASAGSGLIDLATGGVFYNQTKVTGIGRIEGTITGGSATLYYGNDIDCLNVGSQALDTSGTPFAIDLTSPSDYFKISDVTGPLVINNLKLKFACSNDYAYAAAREVADGDLLYRSTHAWESGWNDHNHYDLRSFNTINSTSGYSYHFYCDKSGNDWPYVRIELPHSFDLTHSHVEVSAKFKTTKGWVGFKFYDSSAKLVSSSWRTNIDFGGNYVESLDWSTKTISNESLSAPDTLQAGKDLTDIKYIDITVNFNTNKGKAQDIFVDALRIVDEAKLDGTAAYNVEMAVWRTGDLYAKGSESEVTYSGTHDSGTARKVTFANSTGLPVTTSAEDGTTANASWALGGTSAIGTSNALCPHNLLVEFDIKLSDEFFDSGNNARHMFQLWFETYGDGATAPWRYSDSWVDFLSTGKYNFDSNKGKWMHVSLDLSTNSAFDNASNSIGNMRFGFFGLDKTTQQTAWVLIDNLTLSLKA